jgi:hypothetical protein
VSWDRKTPAANPVGDRWSIGRQPHETGLFSKALVTVLLKKEIYANLPFDNSASQA